MRILIVHHGSLPAADRPVSGGALRAWHHGRALQAAGHEVHWLARAQDTPGGFASKADLQARARAVAPARIVCVQPEEAPALRALDTPMAVDLYAPRLLEAPFEGTSRAAIVTTLQALACGDAFLVSNPRQRWAWLGVLALAGVDLRADPTLLVRIVAPEGPAGEAPAEPLLVAGGNPWPWLDPVPGLRRTLEWMDRRGSGRVCWFGGGVLPEHPRLSQASSRPYPVLLAAYAGATAALDWMEPNPERALAFGFRHADYLGCGLPIITRPDSALSDALGPAGWTGPELEPLLERALDPDARATASAAARALARGPLSRGAAARPLVEWIDAPPQRPPPRSPLLDIAARASEAAESRERARGLESLLAQAHAEVDDKRAESERLTEQVQALTATTARLSRALDEVAGFKREAIAVLGGRSERAERSLAEVERECAILRADAAKKSAELRAMDQLRERLENDLDNLRAELERGRRGRWRR